MLRRVMPPGTVYLNIGHSNLGHAALEAWRSVDEARISVMIHDTIPLDFPQFQRPGTPERFAQKLHAVVQIADLIICNSRRTQVDVVRHGAKFGAVPNTLVSHLGVEMPVVDMAHLPNGIDVSQPYFVIFGTIEPRKNHAFLLDIWQQFATELEKPPQLVIVGARGWENRDVFDRLDRNPTYVTELNDLPNQAVAAVIKGAAGLLFPSHAEGFGLPLAEAAMLGTPVICSDLPVFEEIMGNIPVYASLDDMYLWKQSIIRLAEQKRAGQAAITGENPELKIPSWDDHFNLVLKVT